MMSPQEKTVMMVGATGVGKTTLIDTMANYLFDVDCDDGLRLKLVDLEESESVVQTNQSHSQTDWITSYQVCPIEGGNIDYVLNIVDTPGFGGTRGIERDEELKTQIRTFFSPEGNDGVDSIHAVCFVVKASDARLTDAQRYTFESVLSIFGKNIESNIYVLITFHDGNTPPVISALREANVPYERDFRFNNSAIFEEVKENGFGLQYWIMGKASFKKFFLNLENLDPQSLVQTKEILLKREILADATCRLNRRIQECLDTMYTMKEEERVLKQHEWELEASQYYTYETSEIQPHLVQASHSKYTTNCKKCRLTCHESCTIARSEDKVSCRAMRNKLCRHCECMWNEHESDTRIYVRQEVKVEKTLEEIKKKYDEANEATTVKKETVEVIRAKYQILQTEVWNLVDEIRNHQDRLGEITLRQEPHSEVGYIDMLIAGARNSTKPGSQKRLEMLCDLKEKAEMRKEIQTTSYDPLSTKS